MVHSQVGKVAHPPRSEDRTVRRSTLVLSFAILSGTAVSLTAQSPNAAAKPASSRTVKPAPVGPVKPDLTTTPTLYTVGYAHLDTEWNWDYTSTINQYLPKTLNTNFALFEKYPDYVFN